MATKKAAARFTHQEGRTTYTGICSYNDGDKVMALVDLSNADYQMWSIDPAAVDAGLEELRRCYKERQDRTGNGITIDRIQLFRLERYIDYRPSKD